MVAQTATHETVVNGDVPSNLEKLSSVIVDARCFRFPLHFIACTVFLYSPRCRGSRKDSHRRSRGPLTSLIGRSFSFHETWMYLNERHTKRKVYEYVNVFMEGSLFHGRDTPESRTFSWATSARDRDEKKSISKPNEVREKPRRPNPTFYFEWRERAVETHMFAERKFCSRWHDRCMRPTVTRLWIQF